MVLKKLLKIPVLPKKIIDRRNLLRDLNENIDKKLILISGYAGSGKTVLLSCFSQTKSNVFWIQGDNIIDSPEIFILYILEALNKNYKNLGSSITDLVKSSVSTLNINDLIILLVNDVVEYAKENIILVIDDYHLICSKEPQAINNIINSLISQLPDNVTIILSSRSIPDIALGRLEGKRQLHSITNNELLFNENEVNELITAFYKDHTQYWSIAQLLSYTKGWITGLHLILQTDPEIITSENTVLSFSTDRLFEFFAEDIINSLTDDEKYFLFSTCYMDQFSRNELTNLNILKNPDLVLNKLLKKNIFLESVYSDNVQLFSYQKLFTVFLRSASLKFHTENELRNLLFKLGQFYCSSDNYIESIKCYLEGSYTQEAALIIRNQINNFKSNENYYRLYKLFNNYDFEILRKEYLILFHYLCFSLAFNDVQISKKCIDEIETKYTTKIDDDFLVKKSSYFILVGEYDQCLDILNNISARISDINKIMEIKFLFAKAYYRKGFTFYDKALKNADDIINHATDEIDSKLKNDSLQILGNINYDSGNLTSSAKYYELTLTKNQLDIINFKTFTNLVDIFSLIGNYETAYMYLLNAREIFKLNPISSLEKLLRRSEFKYYNNLNYYQKAIEIFNYIMNKTSIVNNNELLFIFYLQQSEVYYNWNNKTKAIENFIISSNLITFTIKIYTYSEIKS